ncbi:MAG TPA: AAA family ATPase, partial [Gaiellaceae bacterium]|nr:AAA family ATPase [Gaiellaceae bacterium]
VAIVGTPGSGKSTLARELGRRTGLPVIHLDHHFFLPGWEPKPDDEWRTLAEELLAGDSWVMDGAFAMETAVERADTVLFLDFPRRRGYAGSLKRLTLAYLGRHAPDFAPGCEDRLDRDFLRLLRTIHRYPREQRPQIAADLERHRAEGTRVLVARDRHELRRLVEELP